MPVLLDTHAWVWWVTKDPRLSRRAKSAIATASRQGGVWLSMISIWEVAKKAEKQQLVFDRPVEQWIDAAAAVDGLSVRELTRPVLVESCRLPQPFHGDPADQMIVAMARREQAVIVTKDEKIRSYQHVQSLW